MTPPGACPQAALSAEYKKAVPSYDEKPRTKWIFDNSVQNTVVDSRTFFSQEVNAAFYEMEEGDEDALRVIIRSFIRMIVKHNKCTMTSSMSFKKSLMNTRMRNNMLTTV